MTAVHSEQVGTREGAATMSDRLALLRQADLVVLYCNEAKAAAHALTPAELIGRSLFDVLPGDEPAELANGLAALSPSRPKRRRVATHQDRTIEWSDELLVGGEADMVLSIGRDITEQHRLSSSATTNAASTPTPPRAF
jgi:PAS domain-containing protein